MNPTSQPGTAFPKEAAPTLGSLLSRYRTKPRTSEKDWLALVHAIAAGDTSAFGTLYMWTHGIVFTSIARITGNRGVAEELTVEVYQDVWRAASSYEPASGSVVAWVMQLARLRARERQRADRAIAPATLRAAVETLSTGERQAIEDTYFSELTCAQLAARDRVLTAVIKSRIRSGLGRLRAFLMLGFGAQ